jgi:hypothetical protein
MSIKIKINSTIAHIANPNMQIINSNSNMRNNMFDWFRLNLKVQEAGLEPANVSSKG